MEGFLGEPEAAACANEGQGRKTLHAHITVWIKGHHALMKVTQM